MRKEKRAVWPGITAGVLALVLLVCGALLVIQRLPGEEVPFPPSAIFEDRLQKQLRLPAEAAGSASEAAILEQVTCSVLSDTDDTVTLEVRAPDMGLMMDELVAFGGSAETVIDALQRGDYTLRTVQITLELDETGQPVDSYAFLDAMYGGLYSWLSALEAGMEVGA